jgi:CheY-like chemotaxis protein
MQLKDATILIADDEVDLLDIFGKWFEREGSRVLTAENGEQVLALLRSNSVDMIISDVRMPKMDGIELAKRLKNTLGYLPKIIFISGFADIDERDCYDLGIEMKLPKPIRRQTLVSSAQRCLMDRDKLWLEPPTGVFQGTLQSVFESFEVARDQGLIAIGHGGICIRSTFDAHVGEPIGLHLAFTDDHHALAGQGIVRWTIHHEEQMGIEIIYIDDANRAWVADLAARNGTFSFIPRSSGAATS